MLLPNFYYDYYICKLFLDILIDIKPIFQLFKCNSDIGKREKMVKNKKIDNTELKNTRKKHIQ